MINKILLIRIMLVGVLVGMYFAVALAIDGGKVSQLEANVFKLINGLPNFLTPLMIALQYAGLLFIPVLAAIFLAYKKQLLAALFMLLVMPLKLYLEKLNKANIERERPKVYIAEAVLRGDVQASGLSFYSGHAFIVTMTATLLTPYLGNKSKAFVWLIVAGCLFARVYLGAHLPLDVIAGASLGAACGLIFLSFMDFTKLLAIKRRSKDTVSSSQSEKL